MPTAGELLAKMILAKENTEETQKEFEEQSKKQLDGYCNGFSINEGEIKHGSC